MIKHRINQPPIAGNIYASEPIVRTVQLVIVEKWMNGVI